MLTPTGTITYTYNWTVPTGVATSTTKTVSTSKAGTYSLTITDANSCTSEVGIGTVLVNALPTVTITNPSAVCAPGTVDLTATAITNGSTSSLTYSYFTNATATTSLSNANTISTTGSYYIKGTDTTTTCFKIGTVVATINALPTVKITNPSAVCAPGTVDLTATAITNGSTSSLTYSYFTNATATTSLSNANTISTTGSYYIKGTDTTTKCFKIGTVVTSVNPIPTFNILSPSVCSGSQLKITANPLTGLPTDYNYTWLVPSGVANPGNVSNFTTTTAGVYTASIKNKITNCESAPLSNAVIFYPLPVAAPIIASANKVVMNKTLNLTAAASGGTNPYIYTWSSNANYSISGQENAVFNAIKEGKVKLQYQVKDAKNCTVNSADYEITIESEDIVLILPNAFTPNGDGNNDIFKIASSNLLGQISFKSFEIYNRNGKLLYRTEKIEAGWDGRSGDVIQDMGIYFVKLVKEKDGKLVVDTTPFYLLK
jgi:gliding motility-associated-like protein